MRIRPPQASSGNVRLSWNKGSGGRLAGRVFCFEPPDRQTDRACEAGLARIAGPEFIQARKEVGFRAAVQRKVGEKVPLFVNHGLYDKRSSQDNNSPNFSCSAQSASPG